MTTFEAMATEDVHHARAKICSVFFRYLEVLVCLLVVYKYRYIFIFALCGACPRVNTQDSSVFLLFGALACCRRLSRASLQKRLGRHCRSLPHNHTTYRLALVRACSQ